jgi:NADH-quinone oxidoreductase subunit N
MENIIFKSFIPEIFLSFCILLQLLINIKIVKNTKYNFPIITKELFTQTGFILICLFFLYNKVQITEVINTFVLINDFSTIVVKKLLIIITLGLILIIKNSLSIQKINFIEYFSIFLLGLFSLLIMISCESLTSFYLAMEMQALCFYILASFNRTSVFSAEAGLKYFISGSFISGFYLMGASLIYGCLGTLELNNLNILLLFPFKQNIENINVFLITGILLIIFTLLFKIACAPFHFWSPDVYDGAPLSSTIIFSILPKISIFYFFIKFLIVINFFSYYTNNMLLVFGVLSTIIGTFFALRQTRVKKLIIYSSIAQTGFLVTLLSINSVESIASLYFFLIIYLITSLLIWGNLVVFNEANILISNFEVKPIKSIYITNFKNMSQINSIWCVLILLVFFSIGGIPPFVGFVSKMLVILNLINNKEIIVSVILITVSAISVYYYIRLIKISYFESNKSIKTLPMQVIFSTKENLIIYSLFSLVLFFLLFWFFFPSVVLLFCEYLAITLHYI